MDLSAKPITLTIYGLPSTPHTLSLRKYVCDQHERTFVLKHLQATLLVTLLQEG